MFVFDTDLNVVGHVLFQILMAYHLEFLPYTFYPLLIHLCVVTQIVTYTLSWRCIFSIASLL
jgi:hypothetical protein